MPLSWNEIRDRALEFSKNWQSARRESADKQTFYNEFFNIFGVKRQLLASFEAAVKKLTNKQGFIDLLWRGELIVEHKSAGEDLDSAYDQALDYFHGLKPEEIPKYILVSDFQRFRLYDLIEDKAHNFTLPELYSKVDLFGFIAGYKKREFKDQDPVNIEASELMGKLHDMLKDAGYTGHRLELLLVRLLFCLFADDTRIFDPNVLRLYLEEKTREDGSDLGSQLTNLFETLDTPPQERQRTLDESLAQFPYVNGKLFEETLRIPAFNSKMRDTLISACYFDWGRISPAIFGSLFQSVMDKEKRRGIGAHYTSEKNIMKVIKPLFLDALHEEFERVKHDRNALRQFHIKLASLTFLDPACGCGNFLILAYRELRLLEIEVIRLLQDPNQPALDVAGLSRINVDAFYGIEIEEFPARIAEVAMWLMDHQMNMRLSEAFGLYYTRIPLQVEAHIYHDNALRLSWELVVPKDKLSYILGNPPFVGSKLLSAPQRAEMADIFDGVAGAGVLDYVAAWYLKAAQYIQDTRIVCAFVSTNSISQGEQVSILWQALMSRYQIRIHFAHRTFAWSSEARGKATVHVVIIGFASLETSRKLLYDYDTPRSEALETKVSNISPYLIQSDNFVLKRRDAPLCDVAEMSFGNMPLDGGNLILSDAEKGQLIAVAPKAEKFIRPLISAHEFINNIPRWCIWLKGANPSEVRALPPIVQRIEAVKKFREDSRAPSTRKFAAVPSLFRDRKEASSYIVVPRHSSEGRKYIPMGYMGSEFIISDSCLMIANGTLYHFGILMSEMHMAWMRLVCGRLESRYRYSKDIVYNNFPWPQPTPKQREAIEVAAQSVLDARDLFPTSTLADLYDPNTMPIELTTAHRDLDRAVDLSYRPQRFDTERLRLEFLFDQYQQLTAPLLNEAIKMTQKRSPRVPKRTEIS